MHCQTTPNDVFGLLRLLVLQHMVCLAQRRVKVSGGLIEYQMVTASRGRGKAPRVLCKSTSSISPRCRHICYLLQGEVPAS